MILRSATLLTVALGLRILLATLPALGGAFVLPPEEVANVTLAMAIVTPVFLASAMGIPQRVSTGDYGAGRYDPLHLARLLLAGIALPLVLLVSLGFPMLAGWLVLGLFATRLFEGQAEISTAILTRQDRAFVIAVTYAVLVALYIGALAWLSTTEDARLERLVVVTMLTSLVAMVVLHLAARGHHRARSASSGLVSRAIIEIRTGFSLGFADGLLSLVSYLPRYLLSAIGLHVEQGAFAIAQLVIRQFTIPTQGLLFAKGGALLPPKGTDRKTLDRFLLAALAAAAGIAAAFVLLDTLTRPTAAYSGSILALLGHDQMLLSILVGAVFLFRFSTWLLATRFLRGAEQLRIAFRSAAAAVATALLILVAPRFEIALACDVVANFVIILLARRAILRQAPSA